MSFVYAEKYSVNNIQYTAIHSDTKIKFKDGDKLNWGENTYKAVSQYGMVKSIMIDAKHCISFAGNNIKYVADLFDILAEKKTFEDDFIYEKAFEIHNAAEDINDIEFIITVIDNDNQTHITCIKDRKMLHDQTNAWIGSQLTHNELQRMRFSTRELPKNSHIIFMQAIDSGLDDGVGGFPITVSHNKEMAAFEYKWVMYSYIGKSFLVKPGEAVPLFADAQNGGFTAEIYGDYDTLFVEIHQTDLNIVYTRKYRYGQSGEDSKYTRHFMLTMKQQRSTNIVLI